jgi:predicted signal transduction protein with EAL and GGDEF domain
MLYRVDEHDLQITLSVGISIYPDDGAGAETLVRNADIATLSAKDNGRNNYQFFRPAVNERALERSAVINLERSFHLRVIAEGIETRAQFLALHAQNCAEGQGR